ncbi:MAG: tetratricopeptide repeat protein [Elusimicrobiota bacterium]
MNSRFAALALLFCCGSTSSAGSSWRGALDQSEHDFKDGRSAEAAAGAQGALADADKSLGADDPQIGRILSRLSRFAEAAGDAERMTEARRRLSSFKPKTCEVWLELGRLLRGEGRSQEAEKAIENALALNPDDPSAEFALAGIYDDLGRYEEEVRLLRRMIGKRPQDYDLYSRLALAYIRLGRVAQARETYARGRRIDGHAAEAYIEEGYFDLHSNDPVRAQDEFRSAIAVDTASPFGYHHMGAYLMSERRYAEAEKYLRRALEKIEADPSSQTEDLLHTFVWLGKAIEAQGRYPEAEAVYLEGLDKAPPAGGASGGRRQELLGGLARVYIDQGDDARAEATYKRAAAECDVRCPFSHVGQALLALGRFYVDRGRRAEAEAAAERAGRACESIPIGRGRFGALKELSALYGILGKASKVEALYAELLPLRRTMPFDPDLVWVESGLAASAAAKRRFQDAELHYREAIAMLDHNGSWKEEAVLLDEMAEMLKRSGKASAAEKAGAQAIALKTRR